MAKKAYARRPNGGSIQIATNHTDDPTQDAEDTNTDGQIQIDHVRPSRYFGSVGESPNSRSQETLVVILPEPWQPSDLSKNGGSIDQSTLLDRTPWASEGITDQDGLGIVPNFLLDYENLPAVIPDALQSNHVRSSVATRWDANGDLVEDSADTLRLWRDPATQNVEGLIYEPKRTQLLSNPTAIGSMSLKGSTVTSDAGNAKGQPFDSLIEDTSTGPHWAATASYGGSVSDQDPIAASVIVKANGRNWVRLQNAITDGTSSEFPGGFFDLSSGTIGSTGDSTNSTTISRDIVDLGNGWYRISVVIKPGSGWHGKNAILKLAEGDGSDSYTGDGSSGVDVLHMQSEVSREVTSPILTGGGVREADVVNYGFSFPDKTTGVAFSIYEGNDPRFNVSGAPGITMGTTPDNNKHHGALMWGDGLSGRELWDGSVPEGPAYLKQTRNSDDVASSSFSPSVDDETIDRFEVRGTKMGSTLIVRQIAIHTAPHTSQQLSDLESNYLTTP